MHSLIRPNAWVGLKLPSGSTKVMQIIPNTTISLGKYGAFPANLVLGRPYHLTFEVLDKTSEENFSRLRIVPASELHAEAIAEEDEAEGNATPATGSANDAVITATEGEEFSLVDEKGNVVARSGREVIDDSAIQTLTQDEIEELKREGNNAGKDVITKLMLSHTALDQKTTFSLAKYKLLKTKKYIRRFQVVPIDVASFAQWQLEEKDASKIMDLRAEMFGLVGCWGNVHYGGEDSIIDDPHSRTDQGEETCVPIQTDELKGRWLAVDDTCGMLVAAMAERMGVLYPKEGNEEEETTTEQTAEAKQEVKTETPTQNGTAKENGDVEMADAVPETTVPERPKTTATNKKQKVRPRGSDFAIPFSQTNTLTIIHSTSQPNLSLLNYWNFDITAPNHPPHPLLNHLLNLTWLQLLKPELDTSYSTPPPTASAEELASWKPSRRGNFHRKRRRFARTRYIVDSTRAGNFSGLVCASSMDPISILKHTLPLLSGGAPVAIYSPSIEPLAALADCFSVPRRTAWTSGNVPETVGKSLEELERWEGNEQFPLNPTLLQGVSIHTSRARRWQVLPMRTHPLMTERGGADGYVFTAWRAKPAEGRVEARGKFKKIQPSSNKKASKAEEESTPVETPAAVEEDDAATAVKRKRADTLPPLDTEGASTPENAATDDVASPTKKRKVDGEVEV